MYNCRKGIIKVNLNGGIGNQLFQFATATNLALEKSWHVIFVEANKIWKSRIDFMGLEIKVPYEVKRDGKNLTFTKVKHNKLCKFHNYFEENFTFSPLNMEGNHFQLHGYFQSEKYFIENKTVIRNFISNALNSEYPIFEKANIIQIRMGDMARNPKIRNVHGIISDNYLIKALSIFSIESKEWVQISDDHERISVELPIYNTLKIHQHKSESDLRDLQLLSRARNLIISNSTFGWWGAWLSKGEVVAPANWFSAEGLGMRPITDLFPKNWNLV